MKRTFIITGATGFLGNNILRELIKDQNNEIRILVLPTDSLKSITGLNVKIYFGDITKKETLEEIFSNIDKPLFIIHAASLVYTRSKYSKLVYEVNVNGTKNIADLAFKYNGKLIYVSSVHALPINKENNIVREVNYYNIKKVYGHYAKTKVLASNFILDLAKKGLNAAIALPSGLIGPNDYGNSHLTQLLIDYANNKLKAIVNGGYDFSNVKDVAKGIITMAYLARRGESYILSNRYVRISELIDEAKIILNKKEKIKIIPMWIAKLTAPLAELYYVIRRKPPLYTSFSLKTIQEKSIFISNKAKEELLYKTTDIKETIKETILWLKSKNRI